MPDGVSEPFEQPERVVVVGEHECGEAVDVLLAGPLDEEVEQLRGQTTALPLVGDDDRALGDAVADAHKARHPDGVIALGVEREQGLVVVMIDDGQVRQLLLAQLLKRGLEPQIAGLVGQALEPRAEQLSIRRFDRADHHRGAVAQTCARRVGQDALSGAPVAARSAARA